MNLLERNLTEFLEASCKGAVVIDEQLLEEFGENCKALIRKQFKEERKKDFRLSMSNVGRDVRQLQLEKLHGREDMNPVLKLRMTYGDIIEAMFVLLIKASGTAVIGEQDKVVVSLPDGNVEGTLDLIVDDDTGPGVIDIKSASPWSYQNKFTDYEGLKKHDDFGYLSQLYGYSEGSNYPPKGWLVVNKGTGEYKFLNVPQHKWREELEEHLTKMNNTVKIINSDAPLLPCEGVVEETFYKKPTGNTIIGDKCRFCSHKQHCHPTAIQEPSRVSKAKDNKMVWYVD